MKTATLKGSHQVDSKMILERLLELSELQIECFDQKRYPELLKAQAERGELFKELDKIKGEGEEKKKLLELRDNLLASDKELTIRLSSEMESLRGKLKQTSTGSKALRAYGGRPNK